MINNAQPIQSQIHSVFERGKEQGLPSGIAELDKVLCGFQKQKLYIIGGRSSMGKSSLVTDIALAQNIPVAFFSVEMSFDELQQRIICNLGQANFYKVKQGQEKEKIEQAIVKAGKLSLWIDEATNVIYPEGHARFNLPIPEDSLNAQIKQHLNKGIKLVIIDYLQLIRFGGWTEREDLRLHYIVEQLRKYAKEYSVPIILCSQLHRFEQSRGKEPRPKLDDLRDSGAIEQDADVVLLIHRPEYYKEHTIDLTTNKIEDAVIIVAKNRSGPTGDVPVKWHAYCMSFRGIGSQYEGKENEQF